jgi:hypothetical protein
MNRKNASKKVRLLMVVSVMLDPALLALYASTGASIWFAVRARKRGARALATVGAVAFFSGALIASLGGAHTLAVVGRALRRPSFVYDFRLYSLVLLGVCQITGGVRCLSTSWSLVRGSAGAWKAALAATAWLLIVNVPLVPITGFAGLPALLASATLITLIATGRRFVPHVDAETVTIPEITRERAPSTT